MRFTIVIDFDGTICDNKYPGVGAPKEGVQKALQKLKDFGYCLIISSCRMNMHLNGNKIEEVEKQKKIIEDFMAEHNIPYDMVSYASKPVAFFYIDDRAITYEDNWDEIPGLIRK